MVLTTRKSKGKNRMASNKCGLQCETEEGKFHVLSNNEVQILEHRFGFEVNNLCGKHYLDQFKRYKVWYSRKCSDPSQRHKKTVKTDLREISLDFANTVKDHTEYRVIPGRSICSSCRKFLDKVVEEHKEITGNQSPFLSSPDSPTDLSQASDVSSTASDESRQATLLLNLDVVNSALQLLNVMPIPAHNSKNTVYINQKIEELGDSIR